MAFSAAATSWRASSIFFASFCRSSWILGCIALASLAVGSAIFPDDCVNSGGISPAAIWAAWATGVAACGAFCWSSCDAVANRNHWQMWGTPNCGKGEPGQVAHVGHGTAPARFRNVRVGVL